MSDQKPRSLLLSHVERIARVRPPEYLQEVMSAGTVKGGVIIMDAERYHTLVKKWKDYPPHEPSIGQLASNFFGAIGDWAKAGFAVVTEEQYQERSRICDGCPHWDGLGNGGLGKCGACGCTSFKRYLKTRSCPLALWPPIIQ